MGCKYGKLKHPRAGRRCKKRRAARAAKRTKRARYTPSYVKPRELGLRPKWSLVIAAAGVAGIAAFAAGRKSSSVGYY